ncbi:hypothetical protein PENSPDRAFT_692384 [Peniophora sp. CONT]|nr:hypothetical protein PENSPDRAFT_692384 [Peniophora sp. CONT]
MSIPKGQNRADTGLEASLQGLDMGSSGGPLSKQKNRHTYSFSIPGSSYHQRSDNWFQTGTEVLCKPGATWKAHSPARETTALTPSTGHSVPDRNTPPDYGSEGNARGGQGHSASRAHRGRADRGHEALLALTPGELSDRLFYQPVRTAKHLHRAGLSTWHDHYFVVSSARMPDYTTNIKQLYQNVKHLADMEVQVDLVGDELSAINHFIASIGCKQFNILCEGPETVRVAVREAVVARAYDLSRRMPWLPHAMKYHDRLARMNERAVDVYAPCRASSTCINLCIIIGDIVLTCVLVGGVHFGIAIICVLVGGVHFGGPEVPLSAEQRAPSPVATPAYGLSTLSSRRSGAKSWYVVAVGRTTGVFQNYSDVETSVNGIRGNLQVGFNTEEEARAAYADAVARGLVRRSDEPGRNRR